MSSARQTVLDTIRGALADRPSSPTFQRRYRGVVPVEESQVASRFAARVQDYAAVVHSVPEAEIAATVSSIGRAHDASRIVAAPGLPQQWLPLDLEVMLDDGKSARELDAMGGVLSGCAVAIADTGTIVLNHGPGQGRRAITLLPDLHICVVTADQIVATVPEAMVRLDAERPLTFISGPSATSDIELQRVEGVHGPRRLEIVLALPQANP